MGSILIPNSTKESGLIDKQWSATFYMAVIPQSSALFRGCRVDPAPTVCIAKHQDSKPRTTPTMDGVMPLLRSRLDAAMAGLGSRLSSLH